MSVTDVHTGETGKVRTDVHCTECRKLFIAELDFAIDGEHVVECAYCGHEHFRHITNGKITESRWASQSGGGPVTRGNAWKPLGDVLKQSTSTAAEFIRDRWLNFGRA